MSFRTPRATATGLGTAHSGVHHWWMQRLTSMALIPLTILFVVPFADAIGESHEAVVAIYTNPFNAVVAILMIGVTFHHLHQGLQVVIQDYVHHKGWLTASLTGAWMLCGAAGLAGVFAVLKLAFAG